MTESAIIERLDSLTAAFVAMAKITGARLTRAQMCERLGVSGKTLTDRVRNGKCPTPGSDGKWLLAEVVEWEAKEITAFYKYEAEERGFHLYRHFDRAGKLLYVGVSISALNRLSAHKQHAHWFWSIARVEVASYPTREASLEAEKNAIQKEHPLFNIVHQARRAA